ncbi:hypothetical protein TWF506_010540 [Arthrobotrys conoides]|uniref:F-box domain-containing protein n=1 Tax=Arthrobotrys conoides TaxID=74498 RepID=A0AAN8N1S7_9PEZI
MANLNNLATELQSAIYKYLDNRSLCNVCLASKTLCEITMPILYSTVRLTVYTKWAGSGSISAQRKLYRQRYSQFIYQGHRSPKLPDNRWLRHIKNLVFIMPNKPNNKSAQDLTLDLCFDIGRKLEKNQLRTLCLPLKYHLPEFPHALFSNQHQLRALSLSVNSYSIFLKQCIPGILFQPRLESLAVDVYEKFSRRPESDHESLANLFNALSETLVSLRIGANLADSSEAMHAAIMNMKRLQQLAWMSNRRPMSTKTQPILNKIPGHGLKWLSTTLERGENGFLESVLAFDTIRSIHLNCDHTIYGLEKTLTECKNLETINLRVGRDLVKDVNWSCITRHWETLTRLYLPDTDIEDRDPKQYIETLGNLLEKCVNLIEISVPILYEVEADPTTQTSWSPGGDDENRIPLRDFRSRLKYHWPKVSNNLQFIYATNLYFPVRTFQLKFSIEELWPIILEELLKTLKAPFSDPLSPSVGAMSVPLPRLKSIFVRGSENDRSYFRFVSEKKIPSEAYLVKEKVIKTESLFQPPPSNPLSAFTPSSSTDTDIKWTVEKTEIDDLNTRFPEFYGFKFFDRNDPWSDRHGKFWG